MKKRTFIQICLLISIFSVLGAYAQGNSDKSGTTVAQFLKIGAGARAMGMAGSFVAQSDDAFSLYWNPAGLAKVNDVAFSVTHADWFAGIDYQFFGFVLPVSKSSSIGIQAIVLNMDQIEITTIDEPHGTGEFYNASDLALGVSYGTWLTDFFALGVSTKFIYQEIYNESASTVAFDIGSILDIPYSGMKLGMNFSNFGGRMQLDGRDLTREFDLNPNNTLNDGVEARLKTESWELPVNFAVGLSMDIIGGKSDFLQIEDNRLIASFTGNHPSDGQEYGSLGLEYVLKDIIALRGGYRINRDIEKFFYGVGLKAPLSGVIFYFDYSLASFDQLDYVHIFSASVSLN